ncbi:MAG: enoyl-CoA hydratase/isomerase family protein [Thermoanaerobaculia bacterium]
MTHIRVQVENSVATITIDRPERFNSLDVETARDLRRAALGVARDPAVRAVILRGTNGVFCSGADLKYIRGGGDTKDLGYLTPATDNRQPATPYGDVFKQILEYIHSTISEIRRAPKPFIAAVDGVAAAGGFGLAMACDLVIASDHASFEWAYSKTGLTGAESSTFMLPRLVGLRKSLELLFLNPRIESERALEMGLITAVYPRFCFDRDVEDLALQLASGPTEALGIAKDLLNQAAGMDRLDFHLDRELEHLSRIADGANFAEGINAFFDKRPAAFGAK